MCQETACLNRPLTGLGSPGNSGREGKSSVSPGLPRIRAHAQRDELILGHLALVRHIIGRLAAKLPHGIDLENLEAAGTLGLVEAANRFEPERGIHFKTFAYTRIREAIYDELRRNCPLPQEMLERVAMVRKVLQTMAPPIRVEAVAQRTGLSEDDVNECLAALRLTRVVSWDDIAEPGGGATSVAERPEARLEDAERKGLRVEAISALPDSERLAITLTIWKTFASRRSAGCSTCPNRACRAF